MIRYLAWSWDDRNPAQRQRAGQLMELVEKKECWQRALSRPGIIVLTCDSDASGHDVVKIGDYGLIVGSIFSREKSGGRQHAVQRYAISHHDADLLNINGPSVLIDKYWGSYVAFMSVRSSAATWLLRSPCGDLPCFTLEHDGLQIFSSQLVDWRRLGLSRFSINWSYMMSHLVGAVHSERTGLNEVTELRPGECLHRLREKTDKRVLWDPVAISQQNINDDWESAAEALRRVTLECTDAWAARHPNILLNLSGGLDSSIVLACLRQAPSAPSVTCVTHFSKGHGSDERAYAKLAADHAGCSLIEQERCAEIDLREMLAARFSPIPEGYMRRVEHSRPEAALAHACGATAIFSGNGGDEIFLAYLESIVADHMHRHGISPSALNTTLRLAQIEGATYWHVLGRSVFHGIIAGKFDPLGLGYRHRKLISKEVINWVHREQLFESRRSQPTKTCPPGKLSQIYLLTAHQDCYDPFSRPGDPANISPLLASQPLIETCLAIPTYILANKRERALARYAFARDVPAELLQRKGKGNMENHAMQILSNNREFARAMLLDGILVQERLLDRNRLEQALSSQPSGVTSGMTEIFRHLGAECWARGWSDSANDSRSRKLG